jgi:hypothetical protein
MRYIQAIVSDEVFVKLATYVAKNNTSIKDVLAQSLARFLSGVEAQSLDEEVFIETLTSTDAGK